MKASENVKVNVRYHILIYIYIFNSQQRFTENICCELNALYYYIEASLVAQTVKRLPTRRETQVQSTGWGISCRKKWQPTPVSLLGKSHGQRSLVGYSPWGCKRVRHDLVPKQQQVIITLLDSSWLTALSLTQEINSLGQRLCVSCFCNPGK